jgi:hypothetical protein
VISLGGAQERRTPTSCTYDATQRDAPRLLGVRQPELTERLGPGNDPSLPESVMPLRIPAKAVRSRNRSPGGRAGWCSGTAWTRSLVGRIRKDTD